MAFQKKTQKKHCFQLPGFLGACFLCSLALDIAFIHFSFCFFHLALNSHDCHFELASP